MLEKKMLKTLNEQITKEIASAYLYLQMSAWCESNNLSGFANWLRVQFEEENAHARIFYNYVVERGEMVELGQIDKPDMEFDSLLDLFKRVLAHEEYVTASINNLMDIAIENKDYASKNRLEWFIEEQVEEEANASEIIGKLEMIGDNVHALLMMDKDFATRVFNIPAPLVKA